MTALLWNLAGLAMFVMRVSLSPAALAAMHEAQRSAHVAAPAWINVVFGLAVTRGVIGSIGLLMRRATGRRNCCRGRWWP